MEHVLEGQVAIVTGAGSGIGRAIARRLAEAGAAVAVIDQNLAGAEESVAAVQEHGGTGMALQADVSKESDVAATVAEVVAELGTPHILVNNAGVTRGGPVESISVEDWDFVLGVNLRGSFLFCKHVVPLLREGGYGRIVSISSGTGVRVGPNASAYAASKAGVIALTKAVANEVAMAGITVNAICPGIVDTPMTIRSFGTHEALMERATSGGIANPMRVVLQPQDIAEAVAFFASPGARYITGQTLHVNAGSFMP